MAWDSGCRSVLLMKGNAMLWMSCCTLTVRVVLREGCKCSDTCHTPFPLLVANGLQWRGKRGQTDCTGGNLNVPGAGNILRLILYVRSELIEGKS